MNSQTDADLLAPLRRFWGYDSFRPKQEGIVRSLLAGRDTCVVMPTGGGKSLCYQLPAALLEAQTVIVISPLIALMQDQVAQLSQMGISCALLNSTLAADQQGRIRREACTGAYRLLYLSPERIARADTIGWLQRVPISFFAIDEAHCISEWGHEFRPEYRQLNCLRLHFPDRPIAAFTASATRRVRHDIIEQLHLRDPLKCIASFLRPNLSYVVKQCTAQTQPTLMLTALRKYAGSNVIVYAPTIARVEQTVDLLEEQGIPAIPYHGSMDGETRRRNQERWMSDEVRVLVGTVAFGLGINKAAVRAVIHLSLPKSIEQYYQEAGRAGRDGLPADCLLLWQKKDVGLLAYFIGMLNDPEEKNRGWQRYNEIRGFVESNICRHRQICAHFGENKAWKPCGACDVCSGEPKWLSATSEIEPRRRRKSATPAPRSPRTPPLTSAGKQRAVSDADAELREYLREWRRAAAKERGVPAFVVMHDTSLDELCRKRPTSLSEIRGVSGFGERKTELYGAEIIEALKQFGSGARATATGDKKPTPAEETMRLLAEGRSFDEIAKIRGRQLSSVLSLVAELVEREELKFQPAWVDSEKQSSIKAACARLGFERLMLIKAALPPEISYGEIRLVVAHLRGTQSQP